MRKNRKLVSATLATLAAFTAAFAEPTGCPDFEVELPRATKGPVVKATDFGLSEANENNIGAITAALAEAKRIGASRVELAPGTYRCFERTKGERGIIIEGFTDFTFDGKGATLVFRRNHAPLEHQADQLYDAGNVEVQNCQRTLVENFNMDWDWEKVPLASWVKCVGKHEDEAEGASYADFEFDRPHPDYPGHVPVKLLTAMSADRCGGRMDDSFGEPGYFGSSLGHIGTKSEWLSPTRLRVWPFVKPDYGYFAKEAEARYRPGRNREFTKKIDVGGTFALSHSYYGLNGFVFTSNRHFTLRNVDLWACKGFAVEVRGSQKYWQLVNFNIRQKPGEKRPCTSAADAYHVAQSLGYGKMVGCEISMHVDDHFNYHDRTQIAMKRGARTVEVVNNRGVAYTLFKTGSRIRLREESFADTGWVGSIVKIEGERITFDRDLPEPKGMLFVLMDADFATENFLVKDCRFHHNPWSRGLFNGSNATFDGCTFGPMVGRPIFLLSCYTYNVWCEGIGCRNIVVRGCRFENCLSDNSWHVEKDAPQIKASIRLPPEFSRMESTPIENAAFAAQVAANIAAGRQVRPSPDAVSDILVERCTFVNPRGYVLLGENASRVTFRDNQILSDGSEWNPFPFAGKIRLCGAIRG
ncbi:MAG: right-handed parallel beta-helix repeat-containing protein [Kiritimatiellae bacterium]|nr:right-handed parallel beta-helix repeat-containing protein [Kiritimatiellia bacterium]